LLVSPGIFRDCAAATQAPWANVQKRFQKLRLHRKTPEGLNIWTYTVVGERRTRELKGIVLEDLEKALGPGVTLPPPNIHLVLVESRRAHALTSTFSPSARSAAGPSTRAWAVYAPSLEIPLSASPVCAAGLCLARSPSETIPTKRLSRFTTGSRRTWFSFIFRSTSSGD
jgi:hypothetical protein